MVFHNDSTVMGKNRLVGKNKIGVFIANRFHNLIKGGRVQHVVMIQNSDIFPAGRFHGFIQMGRHSGTIICFNIFYPAVIPGVKTGDMTDIFMLLVASVGQAQFPVAVCLIQNRLYHLFKILFRGIVQGRDNADLYLLREYFAFLYRFYVFVQTGFCKKRGRMHPHICINYPGYLPNPVSFYGTQAFRKIVQTPVSPYKVNKFPKFRVGGGKIGIIC
jgi:hypothetical protein